MKYLFTVFIFLVSIKSFCQHYQLEKPKELKYLDLMIERPSEIPFFAEDFFLPKDLKIKSQTDGNNLVEYDILENKILEKKISTFGEVETTYKYKNGILIEKHFLNKPNLENIKKENEREERFRKTRAYSPNDVYASVQYNTFEEEFIEKINSDKKNKITSFSYQAFKNEVGKKELVSEDIHQVLYKGNKVVEITGKSKSEKIFYTGNQITRKETVYIPKGVYPQISYENYIYLYDKNENLISIYSDQKYVQGEFIQVDKRRLMDSANYDNKNRVIWKGTKDRFTTFKYDKKNNVIESLSTKYKKLEEKNEHQYNDDNQILKQTNTVYRNERNGNIPVYSKTFVYKNNVLKEILKTSGDILQNKIIYNYNDDGHITKISEININKSNNEGQDEVTNWEKNYSWNGKTMTIESKYGQPIIYTFY